MPGPRRRRVASAVGLEGRGQEPSVGAVVRLLDTKTAPRDAPELDRLVLVTSSCRRAGRTARGPAGVALVGSGCAADRELLAVGPELELPNRHLVVGAEQLRGCSRRRTTRRRRPRRRRRRLPSGLTPTEITPVHRCGWMRSARGSSTARRAGWPACRSSRPGAPPRRPAAATGRRRRRQGLGADAAGVGGGGGPVGAAGLADGEPTGDDGTARSTAAPARRARSRRFGGPGHAADPRPSRPRLAPFGLGQEGPLRRREVGAGSAATRALGPGGHRGTARCRAGPAVPGVGRHREVTEGAQAVDVVVDPAPQSGPRPGQRLVGELDGLVVAVTRRARTSSSTSARLARRSRTVRRGRGCAPVRRAGRARPGAGAGRGASAAAPRAPGRRSLPPTGRPRRGCRRWPVARRRSACGPRGAATSRAARATAGGGSRLALDLADQQIDQTRLQQQPDLAGRTLDRGARSSPLIGRAGAARARRGGRSRSADSSPRWSARTATTSGAAVGVRGERGEERRPRGRVVAQRDRLLALVDDQDRRRARRRQRGSAHRVRAGVITTTWRPARPSDGGEAGPQQRRLPAARGSNDGEHADRSSRPRQAATSRPARRRRRRRRRRRAQTRVRAATAWLGHVGRGPSAGSWRRIACSSATRSAPGSTPSSATSAARPGAASAARHPGGRPVLGEGEHLPPPLAHGASAARACASASTSRWWPARATTPAGDPRRRVEARSNRAASTRPAASRRGRAAPARATAPTPHRRRRRPGRTRRAPELRRRAGEPLEPAHVDLLGRGRQAVARR